MGVGTGVMVAELNQFHNVTPTLPILQKVVLRLSEHGDVIETQTVRIVPPNVF